MGDETGRKTTAKEPARADREPTQSRTVPDTAPHSDVSSSGFDFVELDEAYENAATAQRALIERRKIGVDEVLGNLQEADSPTLADELLKTLAIAALGFASGGITAAITAKLGLKEAFVLGTAMQTALDDGLKDASTKIAGKLAEVDGHSKATFFASQKEGLVVLGASTEKALSAEKRHSKDEIKSATGADQAAMMAKKVKGAKQLMTATDASGDFARQFQYQHSLGRWLSAQSQGKLGSFAGTGSNLEDAVDMSPKDHFGRKGTPGVVYVAIGSQPARRPFDVSGARIKVSGMTSAARERIKNTPIKDLGVPIVVSGYIYDGRLDQMLISNNEIAFGKNENGQSWVNGDRDAIDGLLKAANKTNELEAARVIIDEDIGKATLESGTVL